MDYELITNDHHRNNCALFKCFDEENVEFNPVTPFRKLVNSLDFLLPPLIDISTGFICESCSDLYMNS